MKTVKLVSVGVVSVEMLNERLPVVKLLGTKLTWDDLLRIDLMIANKMWFQLCFVFYLKTAEVTLVVLTFAARHPGKRLH